MSSGKNTLSLIKAAGSKQIARKTAEAINMGISQARVPEFLWPSSKGGFVGSAIGRYYRRFVDQRLIASGNQPKM